MDIVDIPLTHQKADTNLTTMELFLEFMFSANSLNYLRFLFADFESSRKLGVHCHEARCPRHDDETRHQKGSKVGENDENGLRINML